MEKRLLGKPVEGIGLPLTERALSSLARSGTSHSKRRRHDSEFKHFVRAAGRAKRKEKPHLEKQAKKEVANRGGQSDAGRQKCSGGGCGDQSGQRKLHEAFQAVGGFSPIHERKFQLGILGRWPFENV